MATVTWPVMIAAFKEWYGQNKTRPSPTVEIDGQPAVRKSSLGEMIQAGLTQLVTLAVTAGFDFLTSGTEGLNKFIEGLPPGLKEPVTALRENAGTLYDDFKSTINTILPSGSNMTAFSNAFESTITGVKDNFINPIGDALTSARAVLTGDANTLQGLKLLYDSQDPTLSSLFFNGAEKLGTGIHGILGSAKSWTDSITLGSGDISLSDIFNKVNNGHSEFMAKYLGIGEVPSLTSLAGTLVREDLIADWSGAKEKEEQAKMKLRQAAAIKFPEVTIDVEGIPTLVTNPDIAVLATTEYSISNLTQAEKDAIEAQYNSLLTGYQTALNDLEIASDAIQEQVDTDKRNNVLVSKAEAAVESIASVANSLNAYSDPAQRALYEKTIKPEALEAAKKIAPIMNITAGNIPSVPDPTA